MHKAAQAAVRQSSELSRVVSNQAPSATAAVLPTTATPCTLGSLGLRAYSSSVKLLKKAEKMKHSTKNSMVQKGTKA